MIRLGHHAIVLDPERGKLGFEAPSLAALQTVGMLESLGALPALSLLPIRSAHMSFSFFPQSFPSGVLGIYI